MSIRSSGRPRPPAHVSDGARKIWPRLAEMLDSSGVLTKADAIAFEVLCEADLLDARAAIKAFGSQYFEATTEAGGRIIRPHPAVAAIRDADRRIRAWLVEFGLTPSARSRVTVAPCT